MLSKRLRVKVLVLLLLLCAVSAVGVGTGSSSACEYFKCITIYEHGVEVGHGCVDGNAFGVCTAKVSGCLTDPCAD